MSWQILQGDARHIPLKDESVDMVCTSPPYHNLRNYNVAGQIGLEPSLGEYISQLVSVFREVKRVLKPWGVLFLNLGDSYHNKQLCGVPWKVAFALQDDGWILRSDIIWAKKNGLPESVQDRPTSAYEHIFLLTKSPRYFYDAEALKKVDDDAVNEYTHRHEKNVYHMPAVSPADGILPGETRSLWESSGLSCLQHESRDGVEENTRRASLGSNNNTQVQCEHAWHEKTSSLSENRGQQVDTETLVSDASSARKSSKISEVGGTEKGTASVLPNGEGSSSDRPVSEHAEGKRESTAWGSQAQNAHDDDNLRFDCGSMGRDQEKTKTSMLDLQGEKTLNPRSHHSVSEGRPAYSEQHSSTLPKLQRQKGKQTQSAPNVRNFWLLAAEPSRFLHYASFPTEIPRRAILAGTSAKGCCRACGRPWVRVTEKKSKQEQKVWSGSGRQNGCLAGGGHEGRTGQWATEVATLGWSPSCSHNAPTRPAIVLDPFAGSSTTGLVASRLGRDFIGLELNKTYCEMGKNRIIQDAPLFAAMSHVEVTQEPAQGGLFG